MSPPTARVAPTPLSAPRTRRVMGGGSNSASEIWKPWRGWKLEPAAGVLRTTVQIATGGRGKERWSNGGDRTPEATHKGYEANLLSGDVASAPRLAAAPL